MTVERLIMVWVSRIDIMLTNYVLPILALLAGLLAIVVMGWGIMRWQRKRAGFKLM